MGLMLEEIQYMDNVPIRIKIQNIEEYPWRYHKDITIVFVMDGEIELKLSYSRYHLMKGDIHIIHTDDVYGFKKLSKTNKVLLMHFNTGYFNMDYPNLSMQVFTTKITSNPAKYHEQQILKQKLLHLVSDYGKIFSSDVYERIRGEEALAEEAVNVMKILHNHFQSFSLNQNKREFEHKQSHDIIQSDRINWIVSYIYENYNSKLNLVEIAKHVNLNKYYLSHLFRQYVGENFRVFVSMVRIEISEAMLLETDEAISQIAENVGFSSPKYFTANFKTWFGCSPKEYRKKFRSETILEKDTVVQEYHYKNYDELMIEHKGELDEVETNQGENWIHKISLNKMKQSILAVEIAFKMDGHTYKLKIDASNISNVEIIPKVEK